MTQSIMTIGQLLAFAKRQARLSFADYGEREYYRQDRNRIIQAKRAALKALGWYQSKPDYPLMIGDYFGTRLSITHDSINYCAGQYAPTEIYWALEDYFKQFRREQSKPITGGDHE